MTVNIASGMPEMKIADRTGHKDSSQIARYRRQARTVEELDLGDFVPMDRAVPELAALTDSGSDSGSSGGGEPSKSSTGPERKTNHPAEVRRRGLEPLRELPHWNLNTPPGTATCVSPVVSDHGARTPGDLSGPAARNAATTDPRATAMVALLTQAARAAEQGDLATARAIGDAAMALAEGAVAAAHAAPLPDAVAANANGAGRRREG